MQTGEKHSSVPSQRKEAHVKDSRCEFIVLVLMTKDVNDSSSVVGDECFTWKDTDYTLDKQFSFSLPTVVVDVVVVVAEILLTGNSQC